ncbi:LOW QUALITY PROTEIN: F-box/FBD/LRR-repeat protein At1g51370 [Eutrema salsugineum]|uniref:LOW QUALITY PROTEIN: F-box/FBD/LRR-repeat protein At1g51370 n=1 Tax=Eutrema salsugineum TaxID=72664 RepID=UPI000CED4E0D|nr:LOW QUALITY PROTEIN: F-box/FBD/LRR-repeat protein At1g51370 [Eutrema salsugineum]
MVGQKKKTKTCGKGSQEDMISKLPDALIAEILYHLPTKDAVITSVLSTRWRSLWQCVPGLDLESHAFSNSDAFVSFAEMFRESLVIRKLRLRIHYGDSDGNMPSLSSWIDSLTASMRKIQHLDYDACYCKSASIFTCKTLVYLRLRKWFTSVNAKFVSLPCLKVMHLEFILHLNGAVLEKLISGSPVLKDLLNYFSIAELIKERSMYYEIIEPKVMFSTVPGCLVSSLRFVELRRSISGYEVEMELVRYFLKHSRILEKLRLDIYYTKMAKCAFLTELVAMPRSSSACQVIVL